LSYTTVKYYQKLAELYRITATHMLLYSLKFWTIKKANEKGREYKMCFLIMVETYKLHILDITTVLENKCE